MKKKEITVDYELLERQVDMLAVVLYGAPVGPLLDGVLELLGQIAETKPFREVKDG